MLEDGEIVERGTHRELLALGGRYKQLHDRQYALEQDRFINPGEDLADAGRAEAAAGAGRSGVLTPDDSGVVRHASNGRRGSPGGSGGGSSSAPSPLTLTPIRRTGVAPGVGLVDQPHGAIDDRRRRRASAAPSGRG